MVPSELPASSAPPLSKEEQKRSLESNLDELLERYLLALNQYQVLQKGISSSLATGFISLAQANFSNPNRLRYGQDFYDQRMQASTLISIDHTHSASEHILTFTELIKPILLDREDDSNLVRPMDPIKWFGLFIPRALRNCQRDFKDAASSASAMATVTTRMKELEIEIRRTRKRLMKLS